MVDRRKDGLSKSDMRDIRAGLADFRAGRFYSQEQLAKSLGIELQARNKR